MWRQQTRRCKSCSIYTTGKHCPLTLFPRSPQPIIPLLALRSGYELRGCIAPAHGRGWMTSWRPPAQPLALACWHSSVTPVDRRPLTVLFIGGGWWLVVGGRTRVTAIGWSPQSSSMADAQQRVVFCTGIPRCPSRLLVLTHSMPPTQQQRGPAALNCTCPQQPHDPLVHLPLPPLPPPLAPVLPCRG